MPFNFVITDAYGTLNVAQTSGSVLTFDVMNGSAVSQLSTPGSFANNAFISSNAVFSGGTWTVAKGTWIVLRCTQVGNGTGKGLKVFLNGYRP
jgi:hypothetical protein